MPKKPTKEIKEIKEHIKEWRLFHTDLLKKLEKIKRHPNYNEIIEMSCYLGEVITILETDCMDLIGKEDIQKSVINLALVIIGFLGPIQLAISVEVEQTPLEAFGKS